MIDAKNVIRKNVNGIKENEVDLIPGMDGILLTIYEENPYRYVEKTKSGLIIGIESSKKYVSNETGEMEENDEYIVCGHVIAVGPETRHVRVGDDVYFAKHLALTVPFRKKGYYIINERNITCRLVEKLEKPVGWFKRMLNKLNARKNDD